VPSVFTDYYDPLPEGRRPVRTATTSTVANRVPSSLLHKLDSLIISTVESLDNPDIAVADLSHALDGHEWCTADPWAYGSRFTRSMTVELRFAGALHPTRRGRRRWPIHRAVIDQLFSRGKG